MAQCRPCLRDRGLDHRSNRLNHARPAGSLIPAQINGTITKAYFYTRT